MPFGFQMLLARLTNKHFIPTGNMNVSSAHRITSLKSHILLHAVTAATRTVWSVWQLGYELDSPGLESPQGEELSLLQNVQTGSRAHTTSYSMGTRIISQEWVAEAWSWPLTFMAQTATPFRKKPSKWIWMLLQT